MEIYCQKHHEDVGHLMTYVQFVQGIAKYCGDEAAINYDEKFRQWRQVAPQVCPWNLKKYGTLPGCIGCIDH